MRNNLLNEEEFLKKILRYLNFRIYHFPIGFSLDQTDHIMEKVNEWLPTGKFRKVDTPSRKESTYEN